MKVIGAATPTAPEVVADFSAGSGELLKAAHRKWPEARIVASDIDPIAVKQLRAAQPDWTVGRCDFLSRSSRQRCNTVSALRRQVSVILLNPPFSCRGSETWTAECAGSDVQCSRAAAFLLNALHYMAPGGELIAIVPAGSLYSHKDQRAWRLIRMVFCVEIVGNNGHRTFNGCFPRTAIVRLTPKDRFSEAHASINEREDQVIKGLVTLHRGKLPMHALPLRKPKHYVSVLHSTALRDQQLNIGPLWARDDTTEVICGPVLLLPRVGEPSKSKVVLYRGRQRFALSDCVFGLKSPISLLEDLYGLLVRRWHELEKLYRGTGAKYLTASDLAGVVRSFGFEIEAANGHPNAHQLIRAVSPRTDIAFSQQEVASLRSLLLSLTKAQQ
jgi:hypothetical protein